jgi:mono/diheme cytochrome c family protein
VKRKAANALLLCSSTILPGLEAMTHQGKLFSSLLLMGLLSGCAEQLPESTADGIFTAAQAQRGAGLFDQHCARCHSIQEFTGRTFNTVWAGTPVSALYLRIANTMPMDQPGSLGTDQTTALMAHILDSNGMPAGSTPLPGDLEWLTSITVSQSTPSGS